MATTISPFAATGVFYDNYNIAAENTGPNHTFAANLQRKQRLIARDSAAVWQIALNLLNGEYRHTGRDRSEKRNIGYGFPRRR